MVLIRNKIGRTGHVMRSSYLINQLDDDDDDDYYYYYYFVVVVHLI